MVVICPRRRARYPSKPSVIEARMKIPDASTTRSVSSFALLPLKYGVVRIHMISGIAAIRDSVM
jgi:hypothetical protein